MKKKLLSLFLALTLALSLAAPAWAATPEEAQDSAQLLYNLGLFQGSGTNEDGSPRFALERAPTRAEAVTILVRLLGAEEAALDPDRPAGHHRRGLYRPDRHLPSG